MPGLRCSVQGRHLWRACGNERRGRL
jgi:hypothetical protein